MLCIVAVDERDASGAPLLDEDEELMHTCTSTALYFGQESEGAGTIYITNRYASPSFFFASQSLIDPCHLYSTYIKASSVA